MSYPSSKTSFFLGFETTRGVAVTPSLQIPIFSEEAEHKTGISSNPSMVGNPYRRQSGLRLEAQETSGKFKMEFYPKLGGHFLKWGLKTPSTGAAVNGVYPHTFTLDQTLTAATYQVQYIDAPFRAFGSIVNVLRLGMENFTWFIEVETIDLGMFSVAQLKTTAAQGAQTIVLNNQGANPYPTDGLTTQDTLVLGFNSSGSEDVTITSVTNRNTLATSAIATQRNSGTLVALKGITPTNPITRTPFNFGWSKLTIDGVEFNCENGFELEINKNIEKTTGMGSFSDAKNVGCGGLTVSIKGLEQVFTGTKYEGKLKQGDEVSIILELTGNDEGTGTGTDKFVVTLPTCTLTNSLRSGKQAKDNAQTAKDSLTAEYAYSSSSPLSFVLYNGQASYS